MKRIELTDEQYEAWKDYLTFPANIKDIPKPTKKEFGLDNTHPTIKPLKLMEWLVKLLSNEGEIVLDPFTGSGTTGVAAVGLNRRFIGIELSEEYCQASIKRIESVEPIDRAA